MIDCPRVRKDDIRSHYDLTTLFYRLLWGPHIHHGLWDGGESATVAQRNLVETLAREAAVTAGDRVLDVGCGMGGSSIHLARRVGCAVTGVTLSGFQRRWAEASARWQGAGGRTRFLCADAEEIDFEPASFEVVWSIECTEHLFDKPRFFRRAARWLAPGGRMAVCAWLAGEGANSEQGRREVDDVCERFFCPSLGTAEDYTGWMRDAGLSVRSRFDWTDRVARTWELCDRRVRRSGVRWLARLLGPQTVRFLEGFASIRAAYASKAMRYGCFVAEAARR